MKNTLRLLLIVLPLLACNRNAPAIEPSGLTRDQFIDIYVQLRRAQTRAKTAQEFDQLKKQILHDAGVPEDVMQKYVKEHGNDVGTLADVFDTISNRLTMPADTTRDPR
jgi:hypothetical protein